jgi:alanine racemase
MNPLSYLEISRAALRHNIDAFRSILGPHQQLVAVVKANAYGHGLAAVIEATRDLVDAWQVDDIEELRALRALTDQRALVLGYIQPSDLAEAIGLGAEIALYDTERLAALESLGQPVSVHLKIDALLARQGVLPSELSTFLEALKPHTNVRLVGVYAHFANLEDTENTEHALKQLQILEEACALIRNQGWPEVETHISSTAGILAFEGADSPRQLVRLGIGLYGLSPSPRFNHPTPQPALRWVSHLAQVKTLPTGHPVGYGLTYTTTAPTRVGVVPQGYSDGYDRGLSNSGEMLVQGKRCRVLGRVAMNMLTIDLSNAPEAKAGDEVVLLGAQGDEKMTADALAEACGTISYEIIARLNPLLPRLLTD